MRLSFAATVLLLFCTALSAQLQRNVVNEKGEHFDTPEPQPLSWWTNNPLRLDTTGDLMIGHPADDGVTLTANSYVVQQMVTVLGTIAGSRVVEVMDTIRGKSGIRLYGHELSNDRSQWKSLLAEPPCAAGYLEIYQLHAGLGTYLPLKAAFIHGTGSDAILGTYDPDSGNGGGCSDDYWWFDQTGAHPIDFKPLYAAMSKAAPPHSTFVTGCWAMHAEKTRIDACVQKAMRSAARVAGWTT